MSALTYTTIDDPGEAQTQLYAINNSGEIVGAGLDGAVGVGGPVHSFVVGVGNFDVGALDLSTATGVNDFGEIVGNYYDGTGHSYLDVGDSITTIFTGSNITGIDDAGDIIGLNAAQQPFIDTGVTVTLLNTSVATGIAISANGTIAISSASGSVEGTLAGGFQAVNVPVGALVQGINDEGQIVGWDPSQNGGLGSGFLMTAGAELLSINIPGADGTRVEGINDTGDIVGYYFDSSNNEHGFETTVSAVEAANGSTTTTYQYIGPAFDYTALNGAPPGDGTDITVTVTFNGDMSNANGWYGAPASVYQQVFGTPLPIISNPIVTLQASSGIYSGTLAQAVSLSQGGPDFYFQNGVITQWFINFTAGQTTFLTENWPVYTEDSLFLGYPNGTNGTGEIGAIGTWTLVGVSGGAPSPVIAAPSAATAAVGKTTAITGVSISESTTTENESFTVTLTDNNGDLAATGAGITGLGTKSLTIRGSLSQVNGDLATLTDTDSVAGNDTISINATDSNGGAATAVTTAVTVNGVPMIAAPTSVTVQQKQATVISGISLSETGDTNGETFLVTVSDTRGQLTATGPGVVGTGPTGLTISGTLAQINSDLATLTDTESSGAADTIAVSASDSFGNSAAQHSIAVGVTSQAPNVINMALHTSVTFQDRNTTVKAAGFNSISGGGGNDTVTAGSNTTVTLGNGNDTVNIGLAGLVTLGNGNDNVTAGDNSSITLGNGNDTVTGGDDNIITVGNGNDTIYAGDWPKKKSGLEDIINLGSGNDTVYAGAGETINLGSGHDTIAFGLSPSPPSFAYDQINNFSTQKDIIKFNAALFASYAAVMGATQQTAQGTQIALDVNDIITLPGVQASSLHASNFQFA